MTLAVYGECQASNQTNKQEFIMIFTLKTEEPLHYTMFLRSHVVFLNVNIVFCLQGGNLECSKDSDDLSVGSLGLKKWFRTAKAIVLYLSDGTLQVTVMVLYTVKMVNSCQKKLVAL